MTRLLVFSKTTGFRHDSIEPGVAALESLTSADGLAVDATEDASAFTAENLARYGSVVFLSSSGEVFDDRQRAALQAYVLGGGGYVGIHAASTTEYDWPFYGELAGARFDGHPEVQQATMTVHDHDHPATAHLDRTWVWTDEWYNVRDGPRLGAHTLLSVDESTYTGGTMGAEHPIAWCHHVGDGRCFYTALGHPAEAYTEPTFQAHLLGGIRWVLRSDAESGVPSPHVSRRP
ncbi:ThuA domain-containing protein [Phytoactinopolyspora halotolerans]|uniref:ThuA domain-containing protein n=1 Tax=Phytoactinopolyspora halotolerans TaxID=1981512 RepID=A0A6L9S596_9ACTN|nr:ThuA domain-containing protein [Phytoactinopolyspora halotolerans]NEE00163.1 ThuA domain-containing protein [Phytoactinopolyspora halotolerans]